LHADFRAIMPRGKYFRLRALGHVAKLAMPERETA
jgi:hypothetical protein